MVIVTSVRHGAADRTRTSASRAASDRTRVCLAHSLDPSISPPASTGRVTKPKQAGGDAELQGETDTQQSRRGSQEAAAHRATRGQAASAA